MVSLSFAMMLMTTSDPIPSVSSGSIRRLLSFSSKHVAARHVDVWLPESYDGTTKHNVLYMHDGQMLFDPTRTWNKKAWFADRAMSQLIKEGKIPPTIVVGVWNTPLRRAEYFPQKALDAIPEAEREKLNKSQLEGKPLADAYLKFLVTELKPAIDRTFAVNTNREATSIAGSSMGGLISMYALCEYPDVFGSAACISNHWLGLGPGTSSNVSESLIGYLDSKLPAPKDHRIYFDHGDKTLDAGYGPWQKKADVVMEKRGYTPQLWMTKVFPGTAHDEVAWAERLSIPLEFILRPR